MYIYPDKKLGKGSFNHLYEGNDRDRQYSFKASLIVPDFTFLYNFCARQFMQFPFFFGLFFIYFVYCTYCFESHPVLGMPLNRKR